MPHPVSLVVLFAAILVVVTWRRGIRANRELILSACGAVEHAFEPSDTTYKNIGGSIGYQFQHTLKPPLSRLDGTITTVPREAILYLPIARALGRQDILQLTLYCANLPPGMGHIVELKQLRRGWIVPEETEQMYAQTAQLEDKTVIVYYFNPYVREQLAARFLDIARSPAFRYLGYYGSYGYVTLRLDPTVDDAPELLHNWRTKILDLVL